MTTTTPNMHLVLPDVNITPGPTWATMLNTISTVIDAHSHLSGSGVPIVSGAININAALPFNEFDATTLRTVRFYPWTTATPVSPVIGSSDVGCLYTLNNELYYRDGLANTIQLTLNGFINVTVAIAVVVDDAFTIEYFGDITRKAQFSAAAVPAGTTNIYAFPALTSGISDTLATIAATQTLTHKTLTGNTAVNLISGSGTLVLNTAGTMTLPNATATVVGDSSAQTLINKTISGSTNVLTNISLTASVSGVLPLANGGTNNGSLTATAGGIMYGNGSGISENPAGTTGQVLISGGSSAPTWSTRKAPTYQNLTGVITSSATGALFNISTTTTCAVGDTYTTSGFTYTVLAALSAQSGWVLFCSGTGLSIGASGTLTRSSGSGTASVTYTNTTLMQTYTTPTNPAPLFLRIRMTGGGGSGGGGGAGGANGGAGQPSCFGSNLLVCLPGSGGNSNSNTGGAGGSYVATAGQGLGFTGGAGGSGLTPATAQFPYGGYGGTNFFGGAGPGNAGATGGAASANTGAGGGGGNGSTTATTCGSGGGAAGAVDFVLSTLNSTYFWACGNAGTPGTGGTNGNSGGSGGIGGVWVEENY